MKSILILLSGLFQIGMATNVSYTLADAVQKKLLKASITGTGSHTSDCMAITAQNISATDYTLRVPAGFVLRAEDESMQDMVVTAPETMLLTRGKMFSGKLYAMCIEATDGGPAKESVYHPWKMSDGALREMAVFISDKHYQTDAGQNAVWCMTDGYSPSSIYSDDSVVMQTLRAKANELIIKYRLDTVFSKNHLPVREHSPMIEYVEFPCEFMYSIYEPRRVMIALYDSANQLAKVFVNNETQRPGRYTYRMTVQGIEKHRGNYYMRLYLDGVKTKEVELVNK